MATWLAVLSWQHTCSCKCHHVSSRDDTWWYLSITSCAECFGETSNHPGDSAPLQPRFGTLWFPAFPQTKITFEREEISNHWWNSGKYNGAADGNWENCVRSQGAYFEGDWDIIVLWTMFLVSCIFFSKGLCFSYYMAGYLLDRPCICLCLLQPALKPLLESFPLLTLRHRTQHPETRGRWEVGTGPERHLKPPEV